MDRSVVLELHVSMQFLQRGSRYNNRDSDRLYLVGAIPLSLCLLIDDLNWEIQSRAGLVESLLFSFLSLYQN